MIAGLVAAAEPSGSLGGRVLDEKGQPLAGAKVSAFEVKANASGEREDRPLAPVTTDADGRFAITLRPEATMLVLIAANEGRGVDWLEWATGMAGDLVLQLGPAAAIEGEILGDDGKPVAGATVGVRLHLDVPRPRSMMISMPGDALTTKTDAQGRFRFTNIPDGARVGLEITAPGRARAFVDAQFAAGQKGLRLILPPEGRVQGTVVEKATGRPLADVCVAAIGSLSSGVQVAHGKTDREGRFSLIGLGGGKYHIEVVGSGEALPEWLGSQECVQVDPGAAPASIKIEAAKGGVLELALTDAATGKPVVATAVVTVAPKQDLRITKMDRTSKDGAARFLLAPGDYVVTSLNATGFTYKQDAGMSFKVEAGQKTRAALAVTAVPQMTCTVTDPAGKPVAGAKIRILPVQGSPQDQVAGDDGRFAVDSTAVGPLFCFILARHPQQNLAALAVAAAGEKPPQARLLPLAKVSGVVIDAQGRPVAKAVVQAQIDASHMGRFAVIATVRADPKGLYEIELPLGNLSYAIKAMAAGYGTAEELVSPSSLFRGSFKMKDLVLKSDDRTVSGTAVDAQGKPVPGVVVSAKPMAQPRFPGAAVTDDKGRFTLEHLTDAEVIYLFAAVPGRGWVGESTLRPGDKVALIQVGPSKYE